MKTKKLTPPPTGRSTTIAGAGAKPGPVTIGLDLGDKKHAICVLDAAGTVLKKETIANDRPALTQFFNLWPEALIIMEAGPNRFGPPACGLRCAASPMPPHPHWCPWISRFFKELGHHVIVANPRKVRATDTEVFRTYIAEVPCPELRPGDIVIRDKPRGPQRPRHAGVDRHP